jgi:hypothetical protein
MSKKKYLGIAATAILVAMPVLVIWQHQAVYDSFRLRGYVAPDKVVQLATDTGMRDLTRRIFYVYHPSIEDKAPFNKNCKSSEQTIVLGCYVDGKGIYLLSVTDDRLNGVEQVTAAHETLHAVYARLNSKERAKVDVMTAEAFSKLNDQRIKDTIDLYKKQDPSVVPNELHSILGTEVRLLPADLEAYYSRYFSNRTKVVGFSEQYEQAFTDRKNQIVDYDAQLLSLKTEIDNLQSSLSKQATTLSSERERLGKLRSNGQIDAYNAAVPGFNQKVNTYNQDVDAKCDC